VPEQAKPQRPSAVVPGKRPAGLDTNMPHIARVYDYWLGGKDNFAADREAAQKVIAAFPDIRRSVQAQRAFLGRAVHFLVAEAGVRQFLDVGTGLPSANNTHEVAQRTAAQARVVYVDNDPIVLAHARALLTGSGEGATAYLDADLRDTGTIIEKAARVLDFAKPVAVLLLGVLHCIPDEDDPLAVVRRLLAVVPSGSYLVASHPAADVSTDQTSEATRNYNEQSPVPLTMRTHAEVCRFFEDLDLVEPGVVQLHRWRPTAGGEAEARELANYGGVGRKP
jgi:S-adenosyl methyltransferase